MSQVAGGGAVPQPWMVGAQQGGLPQAGANPTAAAEAGAAWGALQGTEAAMRAQMALGLLGANAGGAQASGASALDAVAYQNAAAQVRECLLIVLQIIGLKLQSKQSMHACLWLIDCDGSENAKFQMQSS